ncbi:protein of unknown function [Rhodovastum atsumiense]|nr:protein of unknown function [Rhodovastum atsumiense]
MVLVSPGEDCAPFQAHDMASPMPIEISIGTPLGRPFLY